MEMSPWESAKAAAAQPYSGASKRLGSKEIFEFTCPAFSSCASLAFFFARLAADLEEPAFSVEGGAFVSSCGGKRQEGF